MIVYVTGGARSGKSRFAEGIAAQSGQDVTYLATAVPFDQEMTERIARHRADRPAHWHTIEEELNAAQAVRQAATPTLLLDCLSVWVNNLLYHEYTDQAVLNAADELLLAAHAHQGTVILVSNEVGLGLVPDNALARRYRDLLGWVNQRAAQASGEAWLLVSGLRLKLKGTP